MSSKLHLRRAAHALIALLTMFSLGLIIRTGIGTSQNSCVSGTGSAAGIGYCLSSLEVFVPLFVALGFVAIGLGAWFACRARTAPVFFLLVAAVLPAGLPTGSPEPNDLEVRLFYLLLTWLAPLTFQFHLSLFDRPLRRAERILLGGLYALCILCSLPLLFWAWGPASEQDWIYPWRLMIRIGLITSLIMSWMRLWREYRWRASLATRRHIRLVMFGTFFGFAPLVFLSLIPETLGWHSFVPYELTFPWLLLAPLAYAYSLFRYRLSRAELALNRAGVYYLLVVSLLGFYLLAAAVLNDFTSTAISGSALTNALLTVGLVLLFAPLKRGAERLINWVLYGGELNYAVTVQHLAQALSLTLDRETLRRLVLEEWAPAMRLGQCLLFLRDDDGRLVSLGGLGWEGVDRFQLPAEGTLAAYLEAMDEPVPDDQVHQALSGKSFERDEQNLLSLADIAYWLPLVSARNLQGLVLVGNKIGMDFFTPEDERGLATVAYQAGVAAHNVRLMEELRTSQQELGQAHQQLLIGREQERLRLAHELHDGAVQRLLGISYEMKDTGPAGRDPSAATPSTAGTDKLPILRRDVLDVVAQIRDVISELRPAGLQELGLAAALDGYVSSLRRGGGLGKLEVALDLNQDDGLLPETIAICLFRAAQEGLRNTLKHADAHRFDIHLHLKPEQVELEWCDDGRGFRVPARLREFAGTGHFGLVSMAERVASVGGQLQVHSKPNAGTQVTIRIPLSMTDTEDGKEDTHRSRG